MPHDHDPNTGGGEAGNRTVDVDLAVPAPLATGEGVSDVGGGLAEAGDVRFGQTNSILSAVGSGEVNGLVEEEERSIGNEGGDGDDDDVDDDDDDDDDDDEDTGDISEGERTSNIAVANHSRTRGVDVSRSESSDRVTCVGLLSRVRGIWMRPRGPGASYSTFSDNQRERHHLLADFIAFCATYPPGPSIPAALAILTFIVALPLTWLLFSHLTTMPTRVLDIHNTEISGSFSGSAAWAHLRNISARPHMYNSNGNLAVREFLVNRLQDFNLLAASRGRNNFLEFADDNVDLIVADGRLYFESNNVIVRIKGQSDSRSALLVSSHFDSTPVSYGTTDDGISVAVMLEFVRALIYNKPLAHDVILNFNNGEEMFLLGGQAFVYHPWFADIKAFINLEGTGSAPGTRSILFRTNSLDLMKKWKSGAPFPHASVLFNDMMSAVASATDYSAYVSYGGLQGVDIAFYTYRYLYHTQFDDVEHSQPISAQHMGENLLGFAMSVCDDGQLLDRLVPDTPNQPLSRTQPLPDFVFYDLFSSFTLNPGWFHRIIIVLIICAVVGSAVIKLGKESMRVGYRRMFKLFVRPTLEAYVLIWATTLISIVGLFLMSRLKATLNPASTYGLPVLNHLWVASFILSSFAICQRRWARLAERLHLRNPMSRMTTLRQRTGLQQENHTAREPLMRRFRTRVRRSADLPIEARTPPVQKWLPYGLLGFWSTLLLPTLYVTKYSFYGLYIIPDFAFFSLVSAAITLAIAPQALKWWKADAVSGRELNKWKKSVVRFFERQIWGLQLILSSALPCLLTLDVIVQFSMILPTRSKELIEIDIKTPRTTAGNIIELEGSFTGAPGSRICSIQVNHTLPISAVTADETFAVWILNSGKKGEWNWVVAGEGYLKERRDPRKAGTSRPTSFNMSKIPLEVTVARETWDDPANRRIRVPFLARFNATLATEVSRKSKRAAGIRPGDETDVVAEKSNDAGFQWVEVRCFLGETDASPFWQEHLRRGSNSSAAWPSWMTPAHGRYGGVAVSKRAPVPKQEL